MPKSTQLTTLNVQPTLPVREMRLATLAQREKDSGRFRSLLQLEELRHNGDISRSMSRSTLQELPVAGLHRSMVSGGLSPRIGGRRGSVTFPVTFRNNLADFFARQRQPLEQGDLRYDTLYQPAEIAAFFLKPSCVRELH